MQRGSLSRQNSYDRNQRDPSPSDDEDDVQAQAAITRNDSPTSAMPMPFSNDPDLELGVDDERTSRSSSPRRSAIVLERWRDWLRGVFGGRRAQPEADRDR